MIISIIYLFLIDVTEATLHEWSMVMVSMIACGLKQCPWAATFELLCEQGTSLLETLDSGRNLDHATLQKECCKGTQQMRAHCAQWSRYADRGPPERMYCRPESILLWSYFYSPVCIRTFSFMVAVF